MEEIWKDVVGYEGLYQVSNLGRVKSLKSRWGARETLRAQEVTKKGYCRIQLCKDGMLKHRLVHRLLAEAFLDNPGNHPCVGHKDDNKQNNNIYNLYWTTYQENNVHNGRHSRGGKAKSKKVGQFTMDGQLVREWFSCIEAERTLNIAHGKVSSVAVGKRKSAGGYKWKYI